MSRTLVTIATDGFRDYVSLPNGDTINLGTTSVLKLITEVVPFSADIRKALDTFLAKGTVTLAADQSTLLKVLRPKKSRWAAYENRFIPVGIQDPNGVWNSMSTDLFSSKLASLETLVELGISDDTTTRVARQLVAALRVAAVDADAKRELDLFIENEGRLAAKKESILTNLLRKLKSDSYNHSQAPKLWMHLVDEGAKMYAKEMGSGDAKYLFPKELRESLAKDMADSELELMKNGEYDHLKKASSLVEAQVETVVGQVETALQVVETSPKANTHLAKKDLHIIATKLAAMVSEDAGPEVTAGLEDLAEKVAKIQSHFACGGGCSGNGHAQSEAESLLSKVEDTFQVVEASGKSGANLAKKDLHTTTVRLASLLREGGVDSVEGQKALRNLSFNVSKIRSHFESRGV